VRLAELAASLRPTGARVFHQPLDVTDPAAIERFFDALERSDGPADAVVQCAATGRPGALHELGAEQIQREVATDLVGPLLVARRALAGLLGSGRPGDLVFVSSSAAALPWPFHTPYAASKAGLEHAARCLALELEGTGVRSTIVRVGNTGGTEWVEGWSAAELSHIETWARIGLVRHAGLLSPEQVADAVAVVLATPAGVQLGQVEVHPEAPLPS
jgi:NAD(P)-dependent dehydrogenase (short-subunit alcohol dehydrogenase family)